MRVFRPIRPECALILEGWKDRQIANGLAWLAENLPYRRPAGSTLDPAVYRRQTAEEAPARPELPPPGVTTRTAVMAGLPTPVVKLLKRAAKAGFEVRAGRAVATVHAVRVGQTQQYETWAVQGRMAEHRFHAVYGRNPAGRTGWKWDAIAVSLNGTTFPWASATDLGAWLDAGGAPGDLWRRAILKRERAKIEKQKSRSAPRKTTESGG